MTRKLEICTFNSLESNIVASYGVSRIELCNNKNLGGTTPSKNEILESISSGIPIYPIIRPRGGDFNYSNSEIDSMIETIDFCKENKCSGVVFGVLDKYENVNISICKKLIQASGNMSLTFHRAFDETRDPYESMEKIIDLGFDRILTSGQQDKAINGISLIYDLVEKSNGRVSIMPGSGIRSSNVELFLRNEEIADIHSSCYLKGLFSEIEINNLIKKVIV